MTTNRLALAETLTEEEVEALEQTEETTEPEPKKADTIAYFEKGWHRVFFVYADQADEFEKLMGEHLELDPARWEEFLGPSYESWVHEQQYQDQQKKRMDDDPRPKLVIVNPAVAARILREEIGRGVLAGVFRREGELVHTPRIGEDGYVEPKVGHDGPAQVQLMTAPQLKARVEVRFNVLGRNRDGKIIEALVPPQTVQSVYEAARMDEDTPNVRELHGVTHTPVLRPDGSVLDEPGYDTATRMLYLPEPGLVVPPIPDHPTADDIKLARETLLFLTESFPWVSEDHRATWHGLYMLPALRPIIPPPYPFGIVTAPNRGSGKGFLAKMIRDTHGGVMRVGLPGEAEELRKAITSILTDTTAPVVQFDNLLGIVRSGVLDGLLTTRVWSDRTLGHNKHPNAVNDRLWMATGNNAKIGGDLGRRTLVMEIDPKLPKPWERTGFKFHPPVYVPEHRGELLAAILTIARGWVESGSEKVEVRSDDYKELTEVLGGMLAWAEFPGEFGSSAEDSAIVEDEDDREWAEWLIALRTAFGDKPFTTSMIIEKLSDVSITNEHGIAADLLPGKLAMEWSRTRARSVYETDIKDRSTTGFNKQLGWWFRNRVGQYAGDGWVIEKVSEKGVRVALWKVKSPEGWVPEQPEKKRGRKKGKKPGPTWKDGSPMTES
jgi:hypothetical protein